MPCINVRIESQKKKKRIGIILWKNTLNLTRHGTEKKGSRGDTFSELLSETKRLSSGTIQGLVDNFVSLLDNFLLTMYKMKDFCGDLEAEVFWDSFLIDK